VWHGGSKQPGSSSRWVEGRICHYTSLCSRLFKQFYFLRCIPSDIVFYSLYFSLAYFIVRRPWTSDGDAVANDWLIDWCRAVLLQCLPLQTIFWLSMCYKAYNFGCMIASDTLFDSRGWVFGVKLSDEDNLFRGYKERCHSNHFLAFYIWGAHWRIQLNRFCAVAMQPYAKLLWPLVTCWR